MCRPHYYEEALRDWEPHDLQSSRSASNSAAFRIDGVCTALLVPRTPEHGVDFSATAQLLDFQQTRGVRTFALNGATGEYPRSSLLEIAELLRFVKGQLGPETKLVLGAGGADLKRVQELLDLGSEAGVDGFLVPVPFFFPLEQNDIVAFVEELRLERPAYLYNLPAFTTPILPETSLSILRSDERVVGVKDSSGSLDTVRLLSQEARGAARVIGSDSALHAALAEKVCDGVVSGVAGVLPELVQRLYAEAAADATSHASQQLLQALTSYIEWLGRFPVPWGLKLTAEHRGLFDAEFSLPLSRQRRDAAQQFSEWLTQNREQLLIS